MNLRILPTHAHNFSDGQKVGQKDISFRKLLKDLCFFHCLADSLYCSSDKFRILCLFLSTGRPGPTLDEHEVNIKKFGV